MKDMQVTAKVPAKDGKPEAVGAITVKVPENAEEGIKMYGSESMLSNALRINGS